MVVHLLAPVIATLRPYIALSKTRLETLGVMLAGLANARTVNLTHLASPFPGKAHHSSNSRRLHRFFSVCWFDEKAIAGLIVRLLNLSRSRFLALDRTNWKLGRTDIHVLVLAIITPRFKVPICGFSSNITPPRLLHVGKLRWNGHGGVGLSFRAQRAKLCRSATDRCSNGRPNHSAMAYRVLMRTTVPK